MVFGAQTRACIHQFQGSEPTRNAIVGVPEDGRWHRASELAEKTHYSVHGSQSFNGNRSLRTASWWFGSARMHP